MKPLGTSELLRLRDTAYGDFSSPQTQRAIDQLLRRAWVSCVPLQHQQDFSRACCGDRPFEAVADLLWPPIHKVSNLRANSEGVACLYLADDAHSALSETLKTGPITKTETKDVIISHFRVRDTQVLTVLLLGEMSHIHKTGKSRIVTEQHAKQLQVNMNKLDPALLTEKMIIDHVLCDLAACDHYVTSAYVLEHFMYHETLEIDGVVYPSQRRENSMNLALKPLSYDQKMELVAVARTGKIKHISHGWWELSCAEYVPEVDGNGLLDFVKAGGLKIPYLQKPFLGGGHNYCNLPRSNKQI